MATTNGSKFPSLHGDLGPRMNEQIRISKNQLQSSKNLTSPAPTISVSTDQEPLPRTLEDALRPTSRAVVITQTTKPFNIFDVNEAWVGLCGYSSEESKGKNLGDLLKGPETDPVAVTSLLNQMLRGEEATTILTNYTKSGRSFRNRLRVGPLFGLDGEISHFVGVLEEVKM